MSTYHRYTVVTHPTGCRIIEGQSIPVADFAALCTAWAKEGEPGNEVVCSTDLPKALNAVGSSNVVAVVGRPGQLQKLAEQMNFHLHP